MGLFEQFPYANFHELNLDWLLSKMKELAAAVDAAEDHVNALDRAVRELREYIDNLDLSDEVRDVLNVWLEDGTIEDLISQIVGTADTSGLDLVADGQAVNIGFLGDSITYGYSPGTEDEQSDTNYPGTVGARLAEYNETAIVHNYAVSGRRSGLWLQEYEQAAADNCKIVSFMFGHNDFRLGYSVNEVIVNAEAFINRCRADNVTPFICSTNPYMGTQARRVEQTRELAQQLRALCDKYGVVYIPVYENMLILYASGLVNSIALTPDGVHQLSYRPIADIVTAYMFPFLAAFADRPLIAWRDIGLTSTAGNATIGGLITPAIMRYANLKGNTIYKWNFYSDRPFTMQTVSADYAGSGLVSWKLTGPGASNWADSPLGSGNVGSWAHDYYTSVSNPSGVTGHTVVDMFNGEYFIPGWYTLELESLTRGQSPSVYTPLLYLLAVNVNQVDKHLNKVTS